MGGSDEYDAGEYSRLGSKTTAFLAWLFAGSRSTSGTSSSVSGAEILETCALATTPPMLCPIKISGFTKR